MRGPFGILCPCSSHTAQSAIAAHLSAIRSKRTEEYRAILLEIAAGAKAIASPAHDLPYGVREAIEVWTKE